MAEFEVEEVVFKWINECCIEEKKNTKKFGWNHAFWEPL